MSARPAGSLRYGLRSLGAVDLGRRLFPNQFDTYSSPEVLLLKSLFREGCASSLESEARLVVGPVFRNTEEDELLSLKRNAAAETALFFFAGGWFEE